jgi:ribosomal protein S17
LEPHQVTRVRIVRGAMIQTCELRQDTTCTIRDDDTTPRTVLIEHPLREGWAISESGPKREETTSSAYCFHEKIDSKATTKFTVRETRPLETRSQLTNLTGDQITLFLQQKSINPEITDAFHKIVDRKEKIAALDAEIARREGDTQKIYDDQQRLRENLKALKGSADERALTQRYTQQLADQESRLETLQRESADFQAKRDQAQSDLDSMIENLSLDATL